MYAVIISQDVVSAGIGSVPYKIARRCRYKYSPAPGGAAVVDGCCGVGANHIGTNHVVSRSSGKKNRSETGVVIACKYITVDNIIVSGTDVYSVLNLHVGGIRTRSV